MGKRNRERRAAKQRQRRATGQRPREHDRGRYGDPDFAGTDFLGTEFPGAGYSGAGYGAGYGGADTSLGGPFAGPGYGGGPSQSPYGGPGRGGGRPDWAESSEAIELAIRTAAQAVADGRTQAARDCAQQLVAPGSPIPAKTLGRVCAGSVAGLITQLWQSGWQPRDLVAIGGRRLEPEHVSLLVDAIRDEARAYRPSTVDPRWRAQLAALGGDAVPRAQNVTRRSEPGPVDLPGRLGTEVGLRSAIELLALFYVLPAIQLLLPLPGTARADQSGGGGIDERALARVRALLAKAESTEFPDEAEALSAKAQQLMARYALERIVVEAGAGSAGQQPVIGRRLWLDAPYANAKSLLVAAVAVANRCQAVWSEFLGFTTVIGDEADLAAVELLVTSLMVQANRAMLHHGQQRDRYGGSRTRSFRQSFLISYASRIGERLRGATDEAISEVADAGALLPVLHARAERVTAARNDMFPSTVEKGFNVSNAAGWAAGRAAADQALFDVADALPGAHAPMAEAADG